MSQPTNGRDEPIGARAMHAPEKKRGLPAWLIPLVLAIVAILAVLLLLSRCGGDASGTAAATSSTPTTTASTTSAPSPSPSPSTSSSSSSGTGDGSGTVTADGKAILPLPGDANASLATYAGKAASATSVRVQSVPADEGFWAGNSTRDRVWVQLTGKAGESPYTVKTGDMVTFAGTVAKNPSGFADKIGVSAQEGKSQLTQQRYHITASKSALKLAT